MSIVNPQMCCEHRAKRPREVLSQPSASFDFRSMNIRNDVDTSQCIDNVHVMARMPSSVSNTVSSSSNHESFKFIATLCKLPYHHV